MRLFFKLVSILLHPILMPILGVFLYFRISPIYFLPKIINTTLLSVGILTILVPLLLAVVLKRLGAISTFTISKTRERIIPLIFNIVIITVILIRLIPKIGSTELYYFFLAILASNISLLIMALFKIKASIHLTGITGVLMFSIGLGFHYSKDVTILAAALIVLSGIVASSRLYLKAHTGTEIILGICIGLIPQLLTFQYWL